jgi:hypothetical protein
MLMQADSGSMLVQAEWVKMLSEYRKSAKQSRFANGLNPLMNRANCPRFEVLESR